MNTSQKAKFPITDFLSLDKNISGNENKCQTYRVNIYFGKVIRDINY